MLARGVRLTSAQLARRSVIVSGSVLPSTQRAMSNIYVLPIDPTSPATQAVSELDTLKLWSSVPSGAKPAKAGTTRVFYGTPGDKVTALASLGENFAKKKGHARREVVRTAVGNGVKKVKEIGEGIEGKEVAIDASADPHADGEL